MKNKKFFSFVFLLIIITLLLACSDKAPQVDTVISLDKSTGKIYLYGEQHSVKKILERELDLWGNYYNKEGMRHLFIESPYYGAELLNLWMESDNDDIINELYEDWKDTASYSIFVKEFFKEIKTEYPETIFHGTDVGHQYDTTGRRFLKHPEENNLEDSDEYLLTQEAIKQGKYYYQKIDDAYRENKMAENFIREFDKLKDEDIMGIYGGDHINFDFMGDASKAIPSMAKQLKERYGHSIYLEDLSWLAKEIEPLKVEKIRVKGKKYESSYFGKQDLNGFKGYSYREFWRLENAYDDFKDKKKTGDVLPYNNYPMLIEKEQVFLIDYTKIDGSVERLYYRSDGNSWNGMPSTEKITIE